MVRVPGCKQSDSPKLEIQTVIVPCKLVGVLQVVKDEEIQEAGLLIPDPNLHVRVFSGKKLYPWTNRSAI